MTFTNDDWKRITRHFNCSHCIEEDEIMISIQKELVPLFARLEAAEAYAEFRIRFSAGHDGEDEKLKAWRKISGKESN